MARRIIAHEKSSGNCLHRPEQNRTQGKRHAPHNAQKVDLKLERDIVHTGDGGLMTEAIVGIRLSDRARTDVPPCDKFGGLLTEFSGTSC